MLKKIIVGVFICSVSCVASALQVNGAKVTTIVIDGSGIARVTLTGGSALTSTSKPECSQSSSGREFTLDVNSTAGGAWYSALLAAHTASRTIHVIGGGNCLPLWGGSLYETISTIYLIE